MVVYFYGHGPKSDYRYLSNFYPSEFVVNADIINKSGQITVYTAEQAIMWLKAVLMGDEYHMNAIACCCGSPALCKNMVVEFRHGIRLYGKNIVIKLHLKY